MRFPKNIQFRRNKATIYGKKPNYPFYRISYYVAGKRVFSSFKTYGEAKAEAEKKIREIAGGSQAAALTSEQSRDSLAALQRLESYRQSTGRRVSVLVAVSEYVEAVEKLNGRSLGEAVEGYLQTVVSVKRKDVAEAVEEFATLRQHKAEAKDGKRSQMSPIYLRSVASWLRGFARAFSATALCDLTKDHINLYFKPLTDVGPKNRNDRRAAVKMFLSWAVRQDYLQVNHRLFEANGMARETVEAGDIDFFRPDELKKILDAASADMRPVIALRGLAGLRGMEILRLDWADVWRIEGHVADDDIALRPFAFGVELQSIVARVFARLRFLQRPRLAAEMWHEQGILVLEAVEILQDRRAVVVKPVVAPPLQETNLHGDLRQLESVGIDFQGAELLHARPTRGTGR